jgi:L-threonylcarbamoyladenylate synthase
MRDTKAMSWHVREAVRQLAAGGVIAYPTETVFGLGCDPLNAAAVLRLLDLKQRAVTCGVILIASDFHQLEPLLLPVSTGLRNRLMETWPGPVSWIMPCLPEIPLWMRGNHNTLAVRVTSHPLARSLCDAWGGPLVSTSANHHGKPPARSALGVRMAFDARLDYILHGPASGTGRPSEIRDGLTGRVLRAAAPERPHRDVGLRMRTASQAERKQALTNV